MPPVIAIRQAEVEDANCIAARVCEAYTPYISRLGKKPAPMLDDYRQVVVDAEVFVLTHDSAIAGVLVMNQQGRELLLANVAVLPSFKGLGIGKMLIRFCEQYAHRNQCNAIRLYTHERMTENIQIYKKLGYQETHRALENGFARVFMRKAVMF